MLHLLQLSIISIQHLRVKILIGDANVQKIIAKTDRNLPLSKTHMAAWEKIWSLRENWIDPTAPYPADSETGNLDFD